MFYFIILFRSPCSCTLGNWHFTAASLTGIPCGRNAHTSACRFLPLFRTRRNKSSRVLHCQLLVPSSPPVCQWLLAPAFFQRIGRIWTLSAAPTKGRTAYLVDSYRHSRGRWTPSRIYFSWKASSLLRSASRDWLWRWFRQPRRWRNFQWRR